MQEASKAISSTEIIETREKYSKLRLDMLKSKIEDLKEVTKYPSLTIITAGSFARLEASEYSDIDMFFFYNSQGKIDEPRTLEIRLFGRMIELIDELKFPKFSKDCQYLSVLKIDDMLAHLGSPIDDHQNYFTARMLLILESKCLYGEGGYIKIIDDVLEKYYKDYPRHKDDFEPTFLLNDICRYWKTILLNYENKRNIENDDEKIKRKVQNFKLKFSRMTTCFATVCAIGSLPRPVTKEALIELINMTPRERLQRTAEHIKDSKDIIVDLLNQYSWFLEKTGLSQEHLHKEFEDKGNTEQLFEKASQYGDSMFKLLQLIDEKNNSKAGLIRHLVI